MLLKLVTEYEPAAIVGGLGRSREDLPPRGVRRATRRSARTCPTRSPRQWAHLPGAHGRLRHPQPRQAGLRGRRHPRHAGRGGQAPGRAARIVVTGDRDALQIVDDDIWVDDHRPRRDRRQDLHAGRRGRALRRDAGSDPRLHRPQGRHLGQHPRRARRRREDGGAAAAAVRHHRGAVRAPGRGQVREAPRAARRARGRRRASPSGSPTMVLDVPLERRPRRASSRAAATGCPVARSRTFFERFEFATLRAPAAGDLRGAAAGAGRRPPPRAAVAGGLVRRGRRAGRRPGRGRCSRRARRRWPSSRRGDGAASPSPSTTAATRAGRAGLRRPTLAPRCGCWPATSWPTTPRRCRASRRAPAGPAFDTAIAAYLLAPGAAREGATLFALAGADDGAQLVEGPRPRPRRPRAPCSRGAWPRRSGRGSSSSASSGSSARSSCRSCACWPHMEAVGVAIDPYRLGEITARVRDRIDELRDVIIRAGRRPVHHRLARSSSPRCSSRASACSRRARARPATRPTPACCKTLRDQHAIVPLIEEWRELTKLLNTYLEPLPARIDPRTGRLHTTFNQTVAPDRPPLELQPEPAEHPDPHRARRRDPRLLRRRARACGWWSPTTRRSSCASWPSSPRSRRCIDAYRRGEDVHRVTAAAVAGIPVEEVTKTQRERAKATNFGIMYGLSAFGLSEQVDMPVDEARAFIDAYFAQIPATSRCSASGSSPRRRRTAT